MTTQNPEQVLSDVKRPKSRRGLNLRGLAQAIIGIGAIALLVMRSDAHGLMEALRNTRVAYLPLAVASSFAVTWLMAYRWRAILAARGLYFETRRLFAAAPASDRALQQQQVHVLSDRRLLYQLRSGRGREWRLGEVDLRRPGSSR